jgi:hypothetical protein
MIEVNVAEHWAAIPKVVGSIPHHGQVYFSSVPSVEFINTQYITPTSHANQHVLNSRELRRFGFLLRCMVCLYKQHKLYWFVFTNYH